VIAIVCSLASVPAAWAQSETGISGNPCDPLEGPCGTPTDPPDPLAALNTAADALDAMQDDLMDNWYVGGLCATLGTLPPDVVDQGDTQTASSELRLSDGDVRLGVGSLVVTTHLSDGQIDVVLTVDHLSGDDAVERRYVLTQTVRAHAGGVDSFGTLDATDPLSGTTSYVGGWVYAPGAGPSADPDSDAGFEGAIAEMLSCSDGNIAAGFSIGSVIGLVGNAINIGIHYIIDIFHTYTPPTSCLGPQILDGSGQSCQGVNIPCRDVLGDVALYIDRIPGVSTAFKRCMKGRLGCGGSSFRRLRVKCDSYMDCGSCGTPPPGIEYWGCNIAGATLWYCAPSGASDCDCVWTTLHEASHSCGALDSANAYPYHSYAIGDWFKAEYQAQNGLDTNCLPRTTISPDPDPGANQ